MSTPYDPFTPSPARMYDYLLGGKDNFEIDRQQADEATKADPMVPAIVHENRSFLRRVVTYLASECGICQFLDIGTGLPTRDNVHQVARRHNQRARVVYADNDPIVLSHGRALLAEDANTVFISADLRDPDAILTHPDLRRLIDLSQPVAVLLIAVLHFIPDRDRPDEIVARLRSRLAAGSYLAISHACDDVCAEQVGRVAEVYRHTSSPGTPRSREQIRRFFGDFALVDPGLVWIPQWRPARGLSRADAEKVWVLGGVACKGTEGQA